jgi:hypothetical protein
MTTAQMINPLTGIAIINSTMTSAAIESSPIRSSLMTSLRAKKALMNFPSKNHFFDRSQSVNFLRGFVNQVLRILPVTSPAASYEYLINGYRRMAEQHSVQGRSEMAQVYIECASALEKVMLEVARKKAGKETSKKTSEKS